MRIILISVLLLGTVLTATAEAKGQLRIGREVSESFSFWTFVQV